MPGWNALAEVYLEEFGDTPALDRPKMMALVITDGEAGDTDTFAAEMTKVGKSAFVVIALMGYGEEHDRAKAAYEQAAAANDHVRSIGEDFWIETDAGEPAFKVDGHALSLRSKFVLEDAGGSELYTAQQKLMSMRDTMEVQRGGTTVATIRKAMFVLLGERLEIELADGGALTARGNITNHEYKIERDGRQVASASRAWFTLRDTYGIEVEAGEDDALILAIAACVEEMSEPHR